MRIVVLGAAGMLGHVVGIYLKEKHDARVILSARQKTGISLIDGDLQEIDLNKFDQLKLLLQRNRPCIVVNCAAMTDAKQSSAQLESINSILPQKIADLLDGFKDGSRLIQISTDGVFRGDRGQYREDDVADAQDPYGISKHLGEVTRTPHLTIRTSIIGPDPIQSRGLMSWFLSQSGEVHGFRRVLWCGITTLELARFVDFVIAQHITGLYHLGGQVMSKYELLVHLKELFCLNTVIVPDDAKELNRTLVSQRKDVSYVVSASSTLLKQLKAWISEHPQVYREMSYFDKCVSEHFDS